MKLKADLYLASGEYVKDIGPVKHKVILKESRATDLSVWILVNDLKDIINSLCGRYVQYTDTGSTIEEGETSLMSTHKLLDNSVMLVSFPDGDRMVMYNLTFSQYNLTETWSMTSMPPVEIKGKVCGP